MKHALQKIVVVCLLAMVAACATAPSSRKLGADYMAKAQAFEQDGDLVAAYEHYQLTLTVQPNNKTAQDKVAEIGPQLATLAEDHYQTGLQFYKMGQYPQARQAFLTALRYNPEHEGAKGKLAEFDRGVSSANKYILHTVKAGDTISSVADKYYGDYRKFHIIAKYNEIEDATRLAVGQQIKVPVIKGMPIVAGAHDIRTEGGKPASLIEEDVVVVKRYVLHVVKPGDSLSKLAGTYYGDFKRYDVIADFNGLSSPTAISVGQELKIPETAATPLIAGKPIEVIPQQDAYDAEADGGMTANYRDLGKELYANKDYDGAITEFGKVLNTVPEDAEAKTYMAKAYRDKGKQAYQKAAYPQAIEALENALKYDPDCQDCRELIAKSRKKSAAADKRGTALALYRTQKYDQAIAKLEVLAKANPKDTEVRSYLAKSHYQYGLELLEKEKFLQARDNFQATLKYDPRCEKCAQNITKAETMFKDIHYRQGLAEFQRENLSEAIRQWEMVHKLDPNYRDVQRNLEKARTLLKRLETIKRSQPSAN
ncbi:MAG: tetratricopeptide repeat protein [Desulfobacterales bacterium]|nr:tetratricopeptide repeat protein [Desulfobacterales bacterium]MDJ0857259.1 tetratricopeptide repeat protein [Desulfobacterales bacterium]MDJ0887676.1 tetratricopeptide repeat protein [Desulfobacterales bacterium]MDJ0990546.1 tetratricopeptide repeat protein [Desulfobacterales bacterium]